MQNLGTDLLDLHRAVPFNKTRAQVIGRGGLNIVDHWADGPRTFAGIYSVNFPNMFVLVGPQAPAIITNVTQVGSPTARPSAADPEAP